MDPLLDELFRFSEEFSSKNSYGGGTITNFFVLSFGNVDENFGGRVIDVNRFQNCGAVICDSDSSLGSGVSDALENLIHTLGSKGCLY